MQASVADEFCVQVVAALSGLRSHASVINTMNGFVGQVTVSDLHQVLYVLGVMKEWLTALQVHTLPCKF